MAEPLLGPSGPRRVINCLAARIRIAGPMVSLYHWGMRPLKTLERVFSKAGIASRTDARSWIGAGRVRVNGKVVENPDHWVDFEKDRITLDGKPLRAAKPTYILLYKPKGYLTTWRDPEGRPTIYDLARDAGTWLSPVGRLDLDTSGLLLLTNDTAFAERVTNPDHKIPKTYQVKGVDPPQRGADRETAPRSGIERRPYASRASETPARRAETHAPGDHHHRRPQPAGAAHARSRG
jgi:16S rRNA U516 pseudouridylate synthase RsuA-like enzyme